MTRKVLHVGHLSPSSSNRLALQLHYADGAWQTEILRLDDGPQWPAFVASDPVWLRKLKSAVRLLLSRTAIARRLVRSDADILHAHENASLWALAFWTVVLRRPAVWDPHDFFHERLRLRIGRRGRINLPEAFERAAIRRDTPVLVVSDGMRERFAALYPAAGVEVIYNYAYPFADPDDAVAGPDGARLRIVHPGLLKPARIEPALIDALGRLPNVEFEHHGTDPSDGRFRAELEEVVRRGGYSNIAFHGAYTTAGIGQLLRRFHFALFPFPVAGRNLEFCLPNKFFQCIEAGLPIICSDMREMAGLVREHGLGLVFPSGDYDALAVQLSAFDPRGAEYRAMRERVGEYRRRFVSPERQRQRLLEIYDEADR